MGVRGKEHLNVKGGGVSGKEIDDVGRGNGNVGNDRK